MSALTNRGLFLAGSMTETVPQDRNRQNAFEVILLGCPRTTSFASALHTSPWRRLGRGSRSTRVCAGPGFRDTVVSSLYAVIFPCYNVASGCPCLVMRATPFVYRAATRKLVPVAALRFGALAPCYGHGLDHRRRQSHHRSGKRNKLNSQFHGQITSFRKRRRCQHTGLTPLTLQHCTTYIRTNVLEYQENCARYSERRAA